MKNKTIITTAISGLMALGLATANTAQAQDEKETEHCFGVAKAGTNDCQTPTSSCQGTSLVDDQGTAFITVPKGLCERLTGGTLEPKS